MFKSFADSLCKEIQKPKIQKMLKHDILNPLLEFILQTFAPYFMLLCFLLVLIIILLITILLRPLKGGI